MLRVDGVEHVDEVDCVVALLKLDLNSDQDLERVGELEPQVPQHVEEVHILQIGSQPRSVLLQDLQVVEHAMHLHWYVGAETLYLQPHHNSFLGVQLGALLDSLLHYFLELIDRLQIDVGVFRVLLNLLFH